MTTLGGPGCASARSLGVGLWGGEGATTVCGDGLPVASGGGLSPAAISAPAGSCPSAGPSTTAPTGGDWQPSAGEKDGSGSLAPRASAFPSPSCIVSCSASQTLLQGPIPWLPTGRVPESRGSAMLTLDLESGLGSDTTHLTNSLARGASAMSAWPESEAGDGGMRRIISSR